MYALICLLYALTFISLFMVYTDIRYVRKETHDITVEHKYKRKKRKMANIQKEVQVKLTKGLLDMIVLQFLNGQPMHGYEIITKIRKSFGVYLGPSTVYPFLNALEKKGYVTSEWKMENERPRKVYKLTNEGQNLLNSTENSLNLICKTIGTDAASKIDAKTKELCITTARFPQKVRPIPTLAP